jgi:acetyl-CoA acetyltransferase
VPLGATIPAYYGLLASRYMHEHGNTERDFAALAVAMRSHAATHPGAQFRTPITVDEVLASKPVASPLKLLDCCPVSDGGAAFVVSRDARTTSPCASPARRRRTRTST